MHSITEFEGSIPAFLAKLWNMVDDPKLDELIAWGANGLSFVINDQMRFAKELLPMYYKHNNMASFIRQLNMYGFHKNLSLESGCAKMEEVVIEFYHPCFQKNNPNLLQNIKRKMNARGGTAGGGSGGGAVSASPDPMLVSQLLLDVKRMKSRQDSVDSRFNQLKMENEALWREVAIMRQKHIKQQQIVNKLIQFLLTVVQHPSNGFSVKRRGLPLMLQDHSVPSNQLNKNNQSLSDVSRSPTGPVIHEIDPNEYAASLLLNDVQSASQQTPDQQVNDQTITTDATATTTDELLDLPNQLLAEQLSADGDEQTEQLFARPKQIRPGKRRPRKPAATKKLPSKVADVCPDQPDITGLDLDDFPLIINGSQALEQLTNLPTSSNDGLLPSDNDANIEALTTPITNLTADSSIANLTADTPIISLSADSPITNLTADVPIISLSADSPITNLTADAPIISLTADSPITNTPIVNITADSSPITNLTADSPVPIVIPASPYSADLADIVDNSQQPIVNCQQSIVNSTVPIVAADKSRYKKMAPKLVIPSQQSQMKVIRPQRKRKTAVAAQSKSGGKRSKADGGKFKNVSATVARQPETTPATQNSDRTVACMTPTNSQQSMKFARNQDFNNSLFKSQEIDNHVDTIQNDLDTLKELLKGESISLDANTLLGLFNAEDPFSFTMDLPSQTTEEKLKEPDNNQLVSYSSGAQQGGQGDLMGDLFDDWILSPPAGGGEGTEAGVNDFPLPPDDEDDVINTPDILLTPEPLLMSNDGGGKRRKK